MAQNQYVYNFSLFDSLDYGTSAPKFEPEFEPYTEPTPKKKSNQTKKANSHKSKSTVVRQTAMQKAHAKQTRLRIYGIIAVSIIFVGLFACMLGLNGSLDENATKINAVQSRIDEAKSEQIRLEAELDGLVSVDKLDYYAVNVLGMVKLEDYKITYINSEEDNHVVISGGKSYNSGTVATKFMQIKEYFSK